MQNWLDQSLDRLSVLCMPGKVVAKGVPRFLNRVQKIENELAISLCVCVKFSRADSCR